MSSENLTRVEARERRGIVDVTRYRIALDLTGCAAGEAGFDAVTEVSFTATAGASTFIDAITSAVHSVTLNGRELDVTAVSDGVRIRLDTLEETNDLRVHATAAYTNTGEGLHRFVDPADGEVYLYTQFEVPDSRRVFAVFEQPDLKATFQFTVTAPAGWQVVSNSPTPEPTAHDDGSARWEFAPTPVLSSYVTALIAGPYEVVRDELSSADGRIIPLGLFVRRSLAQYLDADAIFDTTRRGFEFYEKQFRYPYPFAKYDQLFVPEFNAGAMENAGAITFTEAYVFRSKVTEAVRERRVGTILHELAHMWFGDLVTMRWWNDLWLNESFAEWASTLATAEATEYTDAWTTFQAMEKSWAYRQDQLPSTHPVVATINDLEDVQVNFDGITYAKGGSVLKQLVAWVGLPEFMLGVGNYFRAHAYGNTELSDLLVELEKTSGRELGEWSKLWLETAGVNTLRPVIETTSDGTITSFTVLQEAPVDHPTLRPHRLVIGFYALHGGTLEREHRVEIDVDGERTSVPQLIGRGRPDLVLVNDEDLAYAKIRLDDASLQVATAHLKAIVDPLARSIVWGAAWDAVRDAETPATDFVRLVLENVGPETQSSTVRTVLSQLSTVVRLYVKPVERSAAIAAAGDALWRLASEASAASDSQFQFVKFFASLASTPTHTATLSGLLDGSISLDGLEVDTDLRWELLEGLAVNGAVDGAAIDTVLATDSTANGQQAAARVRAALPSAADKRAAFDSVVARDDLPNAIVNNTAVGYLHVVDPASLADLVDPYFDALETLWATRSFQIAETLVIGLYPTPLASRELVDATTRWLEGHPETPALRRLLIENRAGVERALRAQGRDGG